MPLGFGCRPRWFGVALHLGDFEPRLFQAFRRGCQVLFERFDLLSLPIGLGLDFRGVHLGRDAGLVRRAGSGQSDGLEVDLGR